MALGVMPNSRLMVARSERGSQARRHELWWRVPWWFLGGAVGGAVFAFVGCYLVLAMLCGLHVFVLRYPLEFAAAGALVGGTLNVIERSRPALERSKRWKEMHLVLYLVLVPLLALGWRFGMPPLVTACVPGAARDLVLITATGHRYHRPYCAAVRPDSEVQTSRLAAHLLGLSGCRLCGAAKRGQR